MKDAVVFHVYKCLTQSTPVAEPTIVKWNGFAKVQGFGQMKIYRVYES